MSKDERFNIEEHRFELGEAMTHLSKIITSSWKDSVVFDAKRAKDKIDVFLNSVNKTEEQMKMNEDEMDLSRFLHTCLRKYCDGPASTILYCFIRDNYGSQTWTKYVKRLVADGISEKKWKHACDDPIFDSQDDIFVNVLELFHETEGWGDLLEEYKKEYKNEK